MWIFTDTGFVSLVVHKRNPEMVQVRARVPEDITSNFPQAEVFIINGADYRYRANIKKSVVALTLAERVLEMDYTSHFKDVALRRSSNKAGRHNAYYATWTALGQLQDYAPYSRISREDAAKGFKPQPAKPYAGGGLYSSGKYQSPFQQQEQLVADSILDNTKGEWDSFWDRHDKDTDDRFIGSADDRFISSGIAEADIDIDTDPELEDAIGQLEDKYGKTFLESMSEDDWSDLLETTVEENRNKQAAKDAAFNGQQPKQSQRRNRKRNRKNRRR